MSFALLDTTNNRVLVTGLPSLRAAVALGLDMLKSADRGMSFTIEPAYLEPLLTLDQLAVAVAEEIGAKKDYEPTPMHLHVLDDEPLCCGID